MDLGQLIRHYRSDFAPSSVLGPAPVWKNRVIALVILAIDTRFKRHDGADHAIICCGTALPKNLRAGVYFLTLITVFTLVNYQCRFSRNLIIFIQFSSLNRQGDQLFTKQHESYSSLANLGSLQKGCESCKLSNIRTFTYAYFTLFSFPPRADKV